MAYDKFNILKSSAVPLPIENVDTDQIIPARFLKATERVGFGDNLFRDWRYNQDNTVKADFPLNDSKYSGSILVGGKNFGSGSSRDFEYNTLTHFKFTSPLHPRFWDVEEFSHGLYSITRFYLVFHNPVLFVKVKITLTNVICGPPR